MGAIREAVALFTPLLVGFACHGLAIKTHALDVLALPIDRGALVRGRRLLGANKTWRGLVVVGLGTGLAFAAGARIGFGTGTLVGLAAMLAELPNSFLKRQLDIAPGAQTRGPAAVLFHVLDQVDVTAGAWLVLSQVFEPTPAVVAASLAYVFVAHQILTVAGYLLGMRKTWR